MCVCVCVHKLNESRWIYFSEGSLHQAQVFVSCVFALQLETVI